MSMQILSLLLGSSESLISVMLYENQGLLHMIDTDFLTFYRSNSLLAQCDLHCPRLFYIYLLLLFSAYNHLNNKNRLDILVYNDDIANYVLRV